jgi:predicted nucleotidyltransferase
MVRYIRDKNIEKKIIDYLSKKGAKKIEIFGSYARGEEYNDIDILVEFEKTPGLEFFSLIKDLEKLTNKKVDLLTSEAISKYIYPYIISEKETIYEKAKR